MASRKRDWWIVGAWFLSLTLVRAGTIEETDPYWQVRAGTETLDGASLIHPDTWSWAPVDHDVFQTSPGWNALLALAWRLGEFAGFFAVSAISIGLFLLVSAALAHRLGARPLPTLAATLLVTLPALPMLSPRATVVAQTLFLGGVLGADWWRRRRPRPPVAVDLSVVVLAALVIVAAGSWVHLSWLALAPATVLAWAVLWCWTGGGPLRTWGLIAATSVGATAGVLAGPYGLGALGRSRIVQDAAGGLFVEWLPPFTPGLAARWVPVLALALLLASAGAAWVVRMLRRDPTDPRVPLAASLLVVAVPASLAGLLAIRFLGISLLAVIPVAALGATAVADRWATRADADPPTGAFRSARVRFWVDGAHWRPVLIAVVVLLAPGTLLLAAPLGRPLGQESAVDALPRECRLFSDPGSAAAVLLLRPDVRVWVDGRADYWRRARLLDAREALSSGTPSAYPVRDATCVVLDTSTAGGPLAARLDDSEEWLPIATDGDVRAWSRR